MSQHARPWAVGLNPVARPRRLGSMDPALLLLLLSLASLSPGQILAGPPVPCRDAELHGVHFVNRQLGFAVGEAGTIWQTYDGGMVWERVPLDARCQFRAVTVSPAGQVLAVGQWLKPFQPSSTGVVVQRAPDGRGWKILTQRQTSALNGLAFVDQTRALAWGQTTPSQPGGQFSTTDGGQTWASLLSAHASTGQEWTAGLMVSPNRALMGNSAGQLFRQEGNRLAQARLNWPRHTAVRDLTASAGKIWAVGEAGHLAYSPDAGRSWVTPKLSLPLDAKKHWHFHAASCVGEKVWIVGKPGSAVLHSPDHGRTWVVQSTGQSLPLNDVHFVDANTGWAVGALGVILHTKDGGKSWTTQRQANTHAASLWISNNPEQIPLMLLNQMGEQKGQHQVILQATCPSHRGQAVEQARRWKNALRWAGGSSWQMLTTFPIQDFQHPPAPPRLLAQWNQQMEGNAREELVRALTLSIRQWKPTFVVTDPEENPELFHMMSRLIQQAIQNAHDEKKYPEQLKTLGLSPWQVKRLITPELASETAGRKTASHQFCTRRFQTFGQTAREAKALVQTSLSDRATPANEISCRAVDLVKNPSATTTQTSTNALDQYRWMKNKSPQKPRPWDITNFSKEEINARRRSFDHTNSIDEKALARRQRLRNVMAMSQQSTALVKPERLFGQLALEIQQLGAQAGGHAVFQVAQHWAEQGRWQLAAACFEFLVLHLPDHPDALAAYRWLAQFDSSMEMRQHLGPMALLERASMQTQLKEIEVKFTPPNDPSKKVENEKIDAPKTDSNVKQASFENKKTTEDKPSQPTIQTVRQQVPGGWNGAGRLTQLRKTNRAQDGADHALAWLEKLNQRDELFQDDPQVILTQASANRVQGKFQDLDLYYKRLMDKNPRSPWVGVARQERWHLRPVGSAPRPLAWSERTENRPTLDAKLTDACWKTGDTLKLKCTDSIYEKHFPTKVKIRHDNEYLYLSVDCAYPTPNFRLPNQARRGRDNISKKADVVEIHFDLDRDYQTHYTLCVDQQGRVADRCWGDARWNPRWFVATQQSATGWTLEAAIPLRELTTQFSDLRHQTWAFGLTRHIAGETSMALLKPADKTQPAGQPTDWTLLKFSDPKPIDRKKASNNKNKNVSAP